MKTILSLIIFCVLAWWIYRIYLSPKVKFRAVDMGEGNYYLLSPNMYFVIFTVCTAPVFLASLSLLKYGLWFMTILALLVVGRVRMKFELMTVIYLVFFLWLCYTMTYTTVPRDGAMMLIKYSLPMLFLWLGYSGLRNEKDLIVFLKVVNVVVCVYCMFIGGQGCKLMPWLYYPVFMGMFGTYAAFADYLTAVFIVPILLYWLTKERKYIFCALWMVLSTVLESVRTGMGGMLLVFCVALLLKNKAKAKAIPGIAVAGALFLGVVLFVPEVNEKFFGDDAGSVSAADIVQGDAMSMENIEMHGREYMWEYVLDNCYYGNETFGGGLGTSGRFVKDFGRENDSLEMMHNDYLQVLCDAGHVGIVLLVLFYLSVILKVTSKVTIKHPSALVRLTGIMALPSLVGIGFSMYFDNVVSNSMQSMVMPYIYLGFFLKALDMEKRSKQHGDGVAVNMPAEWLIVARQFLFSSSFNPHPGWQKDDKLVLLGEPKGSAVATDAKPRAESNSFELCRGAKEGNCKLTDAPPASAFSSSFSLKK